MQTKKHICRCYIKKFPVKETGCRFCGAPVLSGRLDRRLHEKCEEQYYAEYRKEWYKKDLEVNRKNRKLRARTFRKENPEKRLLQGAQTRAKDKALPFNLTEQDIIIPAVCPVLGITMKHKTPFAPSLDRIVPELGYVKGNVQVISRKANRMKQDATEEELRRFAEWILKEYP